MEIMIVIDPKNLRGPRSLSRLFHKPFPRIPVLTLAEFQTRLDLIEGHEKRTKKIQQ
jgi:hypothetical protein